MSLGGLSLSELTAAIVGRSEGRLRASLQGDAGRRVSAVAVHHQRRPMDLF